MKPAVFKHLAPNNIEEVLSLLEDHSPDARVLAGGQSLVPMMNFRLVSPGVLIDINGLSELDYIRRDGDTLLIGALTRHITIDAVSYTHLRAHET